jgi:hypothetical protein
MIPRVANHVNVVFDGASEVEALGSVMSCSSVQAIVDLREPIA